MGLRHFYEHSVYCRTMSSTRTRSVELRDITSTTTNVGTTGSPSIVPEDTNVATSTSTVGEDRKERLWVGFRAATIIFQLSAINFLSSFVNGVIVVGLPAIAADLGLSQELYLWPSSIYGLTSGATLLLAGSIADVVGSRMVDLIGCIGAGVSALACGLSKSGVQLVAFRALAGVAMSMHLPCSVSLWDSRSDWSSVEYLSIQQGGERGFIFLVLRCWRLLGSGSSCFHAMPWLKGHHGSRGSRPRWIGWVPRLPAADWLCSLMSLRKFHAQLVVRVKWSHANSVRQGLERRQCEH